ncbi:MAG: stage III sporulation protein AB [Clostridia bacterium]|nr:stage III sporulation protein AB [Clostridia bacterium]
MISLLAGGLLAVGSSLIGIAVRRHYRQRHEIYFEICGFIVLLKNEISFLKTPLKAVINEFAEGRKGITVNALKKYSDDLDHGKIDNNYAETLELSPLNIKEKNELAKFLRSLGKLPMKEQLGELANFEAKFSELEKKTAEESKRLGGMYFKLCVLLGIALMVVVM